MRLPGRVEALPPIAGGQYDTIPPNYDYARGCYTFSPPGGDVSRLCPEYRPPPVTQPPPQTRPPAGIPPGAPSPGIPGGGVTIESPPPALGDIGLAIPGPPEYVFFGPSSVLVRPSGGDLAVALTSSLVEGFIGVENQLQTVQLALLAANREAYAGRLTLDHDVTALAQRQNRQIEQGSATYLLLQQLARMVEGSQGGIPRDLLAEVTGTTNPMLQLLARLLTGEQAGIPREIRDLLAAEAERPEAAAEEIRKLREIFEPGSPSIFWDGFLGLFTQTIPAVLGSIGDAVRPVLATILSPLEAAAQAPARVLERVLRTDLEAIKIDPHEQASKALLTAFGLGQTAHLIASLTEAGYPTKELGLSHLAAYMVDLSGFKEIGRALHGPLLYSTIAQPARYQANHKYRPAIPSPALIEEATQKRDITLEEAKFWLPWHGWTDRAIEIWERSVWRDFRPRDLATLLEDVSVDEALIFSAARRAGYGDGDADMLTGALIQRSLKSRRQALISRAQRAYADGWLPREDLGLVLDQVGVRPAEAALIRADADLAARVDAQAELAKLYEQQARAGLITTDDLRVGLEVIGMDPGRAQIVVGRVQAARAAKIAAKERAETEKAIREAQSRLIPQYRDLLELGLLSEEGYRAALVQLGIDPGLAAQAAHLEQLRLQGRAGRVAGAALQRELLRDGEQRATLYLEQYRRAQLDRGQLLAALAAVGIPGPRAEQLVALEDVRRVPIPSRKVPEPLPLPETPVGREARALFLDQYRVGIIDEQQLSAALAELGLDPDLVSLVVAREQLKRRPAPRPASAG